MALRVGQAFAGYTVIGQLGGGGMGEVHLAQHPWLPRQDALKILKAAISADRARIGAPHRRSFSHPYGVNRGR